MFGAARGTAALLTWGLVGVACASEPTADTTFESVPSTGADAHVDADPDEHAFEGRTDLLYLVMNDAEFTIDVRVPSGEGGRRDRPVLVLFHGLSSATNDADDVTVVAAAAAAGGMVVFTPEWILDDPTPILFDDIAQLRRAGECAVAFAQQHAPSFGGDPTRTVTSGFSAGTGPALTAAVTPITGEPLDGCLADPKVTAVVGTVLGDGEYFWQSQPFDAAFTADPVRMLRATELFIQPTSWDADPDLIIRLWAAAERTAPRPLVSAADDAGGTADAVDWLTERDPDGTIRLDLDSVGALDDGVLDYVDSAALLERRAAAAGYDVELEILPGGHTVSDKAPSIVEHLLTVAGES